MTEPSTVDETEQAESARKIKELLIEVQSAAYGYATTYTTVVIFGAYAALFTVWSHSKEALSESETARVAMLMGISVIAFVGFEVLKMLVTSREFMRIRALLVNEHPPAVFLEKREALARSQNLFAQRVLLPIWVFTLLVTIITGFGAAFLLFGSFFSILCEFPDAPITADRSISRLVRPISLHSSSDFP